MKKNQLTPQVGKVYVIKIDEIGKPSPSVREFDSNIDSINKGEITIMVLGPTSGSYLAVCDLCWTWCDKCATRSNPHQSDWTVEGNFERITKA